MERCCAATAYVRGAEWKSDYPFFDHAAVRANGHCTIHALIFQGQIVGFARLVALRGGQFDVLALWHCYLFEFSDESGAVCEVGEDVAAGGAGVVLREVGRNAFVAVNFGGVRAHLGLLVGTAAEQAQQFVHSIIIIILRKGGQGLTKGKSRKPEAGWKTSIKSL